MPKLPVLKPQEVVAWALANSWPRSALPKSIGATKLRKFQVFQKGMVQITGYQGNKPTMPVCQWHWHGTQGSAGSVTLD